jgi:drug/metabolite transporter (DMT)-like permease
LAFFLLNEPLTLSLLIGAILVSTGIYLTNSGFGKLRTQVDH